MKSNQQSFLMTIITTLRDALKDQGIAMIVVFAPIIYGFYYPWPYSTEVARNIPIAVVDNSNDSLSRQMIRLVTASPAVSVTSLQSEAQAKHELLTNAIMGYMIIPNNLKRDVMKGVATAVTVVGNDNYLLASKQAQKAMASAVLTLSAGIEMKRFSAYGLSSEQQQTLANPVPLNIDPLHNANEGYGSYVVPAVAWLILQQTLLMGCAMLVGNWFERGAAYARPRVWIGRIVAMSCLHYLVCLGYVGWLFYGWGYQSGGNPLGNILLIALFSPCVACAGFVLGLWIKDRERAMQLLIFSSIPMYFTSGFSWPSQQLPWLLDTIGWIFPSTSAIRAGVNFNQLNAPIVDNIHYLLALCIIFIVSFVMVMYWGRKRIGSN